MKYYSEKLKDLFDSAEACAEAEEKYEKEQAEKEAKAKALKEERATRAKEVENAYKAIVEAQKHYAELKNKFIEDYGSFHMSYNTQIPIPQVNNLDNFFNAMFNLL